MEILRKAAVSSLGRPVTGELLPADRRGEAHHDVSRLARVRGYARAGYHAWVCRLRGLTRRDPQAAPAPDLVERNFTTPTDYEQQHRSPAPTT